MCKIYLYNKMIVVFEIYNIYIKSIKYSIPIYVNINYLHYITL